MSILRPVSQPAPAPERPASRLARATDVVVPDPCPAKVVERPTDCLQALSPGSDPVPVTPLVAEAGAGGPGDQRAVQQAER